MNNYTNRWTDSGGRTVIIHWLVDFHPPWEKQKQKPKLNFRSKYSRETYTDNTRKYLKAKVWLNFVILHSAKKNNQLIWFQTSGWILAKSDHKVTHLKRLIYIIVIRNGKKETFCFLWICLHLMKSISEEIRLCYFNRKIHCKKSFLQILWRFSLFLG